MIGKSARLERTFSAEDIRAFSVLTGDLNPLHVPAAPAAGGRARRPLVQGAFLSGLGATLVGSELPGPGTVYLSQTFEYLFPVFAGETVEVRGEVTAYDESDRRYTIAIRCRNEADELVMQGTMIVRLNERP